jgi:aminoglycoside/choline kinase family phosphotransferase
VLPPYDDALLSRELALFPDWYLEKHRGVVLQGKQREVLDQAFRLIVANNLAQPQVYVHRDFMPRNLMIRLRRMNPAWACWTSRTPSTAPSPTTSPASCAMPS